MITHACAAALMVDDFEVDVNDLREDFKIEKNQYVSRLAVCMNLAVLTEIGSNNTSQSWAADSTFPPRAIATDSRSRKQRATAMLSQSCDYL